eukprot:6895325-Prymnesium_polylepis.1
MSHIPAAALEARCCGDAELGVFTMDDPPGDGGDDWYLRTYFETAAPPPSAEGRGGAQEARWRTRLSLRWESAGRLARGKRVRMAVERLWATDAGTLNGELNQGGASLVAGKTAATGCDARCRARPFSDSRLRRASPLVTCGTRAACQLRRGRHRRTVLRFPHGRWRRYVQRARRRKVASPGRRG